MVVSDWSILYLGNSDGQRPVGSGTEERRQSDLSGLLRLWLYSLVCGCLISGNWICRTLVENFSLEKRQKISFWYLAFLHSVPVSLPYPRKRRVHDQQDKTNDGRRGLAEVLGDRRELLSLTAGSPHRSGRVWRTQDPAGFPQPSCFSGGSDRQAPVGRVWHRVQC